MDSRFRQIVLLMLSATLPGEVAAARDALVRQAKAQGKDVHALAQTFVDGLGGPKPNAADWKPNAEADFGGEMSAREKAQWCLDRFNEEWGAKPRSDREFEFINDMAGRWGKPTEKQADWLNSIYGRLKRQTGG